MKKLKQLLQRCCMFGNAPKRKEAPLVQPILVQVDKKDTFLLYTENRPTVHTPIGRASQLQRLKPGQVIPGKLSPVDQSRLKLLKSLNATSSKQALDELFDLKAYDSISLTLRKKNADPSFYKYLAKKALNTKDYHLALRLVKDLQKPIIYKEIIEAIVYNKDYEALRPAIQSIEAYIRYYHRLSVVEANTYKHYAYAFAALAAAKDKAYTFAFNCAEQMGRCYYVWVDLVAIIAQNQDFWEVERFAESAEHLRDTAYAAALAYCEENSPWAAVFTQKCKKADSVVSVF